MEREEGSRRTGGRRTRTQHGWHIFADYRIVFWMPQGFDLFTLRQAISVDGLLSTVGPREKSEQALKEYLWKIPIDDLWRHIVAHARPWPDVLRGPGRPERILSR